MEYRKLTDLKKLENNPRTITKDGMDRLIASIKRVGFLKGMECRYDERLPLKEYYDMTIQQCNLYRGLLRVNKFSYNKRSVTNTGGCSQYRTLEKEKDQLALLQKKWGNKIVKYDNNDRNHRSTKKKAFDINPVISIPIKGV